MKTIKIGILGAGRGVDIARTFMLLGCEIVALCDNNNKRLNDGAKKLTNTVTLYTDFDEFIKHKMDAVVLANYFHEHAPFAIKCFEKGLHVFSECISNGTMKEGVELIRAFEKSKSIYMLAENYPEMIFNREIKRVCDSGSLGKILYAEGEYNHPVSTYDKTFIQKYVYSENHWRNYIPRAYYITHSLGPLMWATGATPSKVSALAVFAPEGENCPSVDRVGDKVAIITTQNDDGSVFRFTGCAAFGGHHNSYRICGTNGQIENLRGMGERIMLRYNEWSKPENADTEQFYEPKWNDEDERFIKQSGHGGSDYLTARRFLNCIKENKQPEHPFDIYSAVTISSVAILGHRSVLNGGIPYEIPDFRNEEYRKLYEKDTLSPFPSIDGNPPTIPCYSHKEYSLTEKQIRNYYKLLN